MLKLKLHDSDPTILASEGSKPVAAELAPSQPILGPLEEIVKKRVGGSLLGKAKVRTFCAHAMETLARNCESSSFCPTNQSFKASLPKHLLVRPAQNQRVFFFWTEGWMTSIQEPYFLSLLICTQKVCVFVSRFDKVHTILHVRDISNKGSYRSCLNFLTHQVYRAHL